MKSWTVYEHISPSGKVYVGITSNVKRRWAANGYYYHLSDTVFSRALKKYGWDNFTHHIVLEGISAEEAKYTEKYLIRWYKIHGMSYNITDGGDGYVGEHSKEHIQHIVESRLANSNTDYLVIDKNFNYIICETQPEAAKYLGVSQRNIAHVLRQPIGYTCKKHYLWKHRKGAAVDIENIRTQIQNALDIRKQKMSAHTKAISAKMVAASKKERESLTSDERKQRYQYEHKKGWHHREETKQKISAAAKGRNMSKAVTASKKLSSVPVVQMLNGMVINTFSSIREAARVLNVSAANISSCAKGKRRTVKGFNWMFKKEMEAQYV